MTTPDAPFPASLPAESLTLLPELVALRRDLHAHPEVGLDLPTTQQTVVAALAPLTAQGLEITTGKRLSSVTAVLRGTGRERPADGAPAVLLRGDMDALPVAEQTGLDFAARNGNMHACGHDLHTAGLVGAARLLTAHRHELPGDVVFMFQPGEEGYGGAKLMIEEGVLDAAGPRVSAAYGLHVLNEPTGILTTKPGTLQTGSNRLRVTVTGAGGHGSRPYAAVDPVPALAAIVTGLQTMVTRRFDALDPVVLSVTQLRAGDGEAVNIIPETASLAATVRVLSAHSLEVMIAETKRVAEGIAAAHGCTAAVEFEVQYPTTINDEAETTWVLGELGALLGADRALLRPHPLMPSEDFSFVLNEVPGTYLTLGARRNDIPEDRQADNHSPFVVFDDAVLADGAAVLAYLAARRLHREL